MQPDLQPSRASMKGPGHSERAEWRQKVTMYIQVKSQGLKGEGKGAGRKYDSDPERQTGLQSLLCLCPYHWLSGDKPWPEKTVSEQEETPSKLSKAISYLNFDSHWVSVTDFNHNTRPR